MHIHRIFAVATFILCGSVPVIASAFEIVIQEEVQHDHKKNGALHSHQNSYYKSNAQEEYIYNTSNRDSKLAVNNLLSFLSDNVIGKDSNDIVSSEKKLEPQDAHQLKLAAEMAEDGNMGGAIKLYELVLEKYPDNESALGLLAYAYAKGGNLDRAIDIYMQILKNNPANNDALKNLASVSVAKYGMIAEPIVILSNEFCKTKGMNVLLNRISLAPSNSR